MVSTTEVATDVFHVAAVPGINVWLVRDADEWTVVDTGIPLVAGRIVEVLKGFGAKPGDLRRIVLTHCHPDHAGGVDGVREFFGHDVDVLVGPDDVGFLRTGTRPPSDPSKLSGRLTNRFMSSGPKVEDVQALSLTEPLPIGGGIEVVPTPGHSPGHVALRFTAHDLVIGGDVVFNVWRTIPSFAAFCSSVEGNRESMLTIADLDPGTLLLCHGAPIDDDPAGRLREVAARSAP